MGVGLTGACLRVESRGPEAGGPIHSETPTDATDCAAWTARALRGWRRVTVFNSSLMVVNIRGSLEIHSPHCEVSFDDRLTATQWETANEHVVHADRRSR